MQASIECQLIRSNSYTNIIQKNELKYLISHKCKGHIRINSLILPQALYTTNLFHIIMLISLTVLDNIIDVYAFKNKFKIKFTLLKK